MKRRCNTQGMKTLSEEKKNLLYFLLLRNQKGLIENESIANNG